MTPTKYLAVSRDKINQNWIKSISILIFYAEACYKFAFLNRRYIY